MGPAMVITVGVLFLLQQVRDGEFGFSSTWPFLLIVSGVILLGSSIAPTTGHVDAMAPPAGTPPGPPPGSPLPPPSGQGR